MQPSSILNLPFDIKQVDVPQRIIVGHASIFDTEDKVADIVDRKAFDRTLREQKPADIGVFIAHDYSQLPIGIPLDVHPDATGLYTKTFIFETARGDDLLQTAKALLDRGQTLGQSIGYKARDFKMERGGRGTKAVRRLLDVDLMEYSFAASQIIAHPDALVTGVKALTTDQLNALDDSDFAYIDQNGGRHLPIHDPDHVRNALARFDQTDFESDAAKEKARAKVDAAAKKFGIGDAADASKVAHNGKDDEWEAGDPQDDGKPTRTKTDGKTFTWSLVGDGLEIKVKMNPHDLGALHDAMKNLSALHDANCHLGSDCPMNDADGDADGADGGDGDGKTVAPTAETKAAEETTLSEDATARAAWNWLRERNQALAARVGPDASQAETEAAAPER